MTKDQIKAELFGITQSTESLLLKVHGDIDVEAFVEERKILSHKLVALLQHCRALSNTKMQCQINLMKARKRLKLLKLLLISKTDFINNKQKTFA